jgi:hypothetical protein
MIVTHIRMLLCQHTMKETCYILYIIKHTTSDINHGKEGLTFTLGYED